MAFRYSTRVRFHDADPAGIAFFARVFFYCHDAYEEMMRQHGVALEGFIEGDVGLPVADVSAEYLRPMRSGAEITVVVSVAERRGKGFTLSHEVLGSDGEPCARVKAVHIAMSRQTGRATQLPERIVSALDAILKEAT